MTRWLELQAAAASPHHLRDFVATRLSMDPSVASTETHIVFDWSRGIDHGDDSDDGFDELRDPIG